MFKKIIAPALLAATVATAVFAAEPVELNDANTAKIREMLTEQGYEVGKIKIEDGMYEAYARKDGKKYEVFLDGDFAVIRTEED
ncbi:PepSY domain-containing protein [Arenibacterium sp. CAU 1754]